MAKVLKVGDKKVVVKNDNGSVNELNKKVFNYDPEVNDEIEVFKFKNNFLVRKKLISKVDEKAIVKNAMKREKKVEINSEQILKSQKKKKNIIMLINIVASFVSIFLLIAMPLILFPNEHYLFDDLISKSNKLILAKENDINAAGLNVKFIDMEYTDKLVLGTEDNQFEVHKKNKRDEFIVFKLKVKNVSENKMNFNSLFNKNYNFSVKCCDSDSYSSEHNNHNYDLNVIEAEGLFASEITFEPEDEYLIYLYVDVPIEIEKEKVIGTFVINGIECICYGE